jgi:hypothetical protein
LPSIENSLVEENSPPCFSAVAGIATNASRSATARMEWTRFNGKTPMRHIRR